MREKKYRAWADGKMHYPTEEVWWYFSSTGYWSLNIGDGPGEIICDSLESENPHLMEYTGLKDKNGKEIYHKDRVRFLTIDPETSASDEWTGVIEWDDEDMCWYIDNDNDVWPVVKFRFIDYFEIIGNDFETPEKVKP